MTGGPLPLEVRVLGLAMTAQGLVAMDVPKIAAVLNMPQLAVAQAVDRLEADGLVERTADRLVSLSSDFLPDASLCSRMGTVVRFPVAQVRDGDAA